MGTRAFCLALSLILLTLPALAADPEEIKLSEFVCTDGPETFGQKSCAKVKAEAEKLLKENTKHVIAHYYEGKALDLDFRPEGKGACVSKNVTVPICNSADTKASPNGEVFENHKGQRCGEFTNTAPVSVDACFDMYDASTRSFPPEASSACNTEALAFANSNLKELKGYLSNPLTKTLVEALLDSKTNFVKMLKDDWQDYLDSNPDGFCRIVNGTLDFTTCRWEMAQIRGMRSQLWQHHYEQVVNEIKSGTLKVQPTDAAGTRPCGTFAAAIKKLIQGEPNRPGIKETHDELVTGFDLTKKPLNTSELEGCLAAEKGVGDATHLAMSQSAFSDKNGLQRENKHISQGFCDLAYARLNVESLFYQLASCEVMTRAKSEYYTRYFSMDAFLKELNERVVKPCAKHAKSESGYSCRRGCATRHFYRCYKNGDPNEGDSDLNSVQAIGGAIGFFKSTITNSIPVSQSLAPFTKLKERKIDPVRKIATDEVIGDLNITNSCSALSMFPIFGGARASLRLRGRKRRRYLRALVAMLVILSALFSGCGDDDEAAIPPVFCPDTMESTGITCGDEDSACRDDAIAQKCPPPGGADAVVSGGSLTNGGFEAVDQAQSLLSNEKGVIAQAGPKKNGNVAQSAAEAQVRDKNPIEKASKKTGGGGAVGVLPSFVDSVKNTVASIGGQSIADSLLGAASRSDEQLSGEEKDKESAAAAQGNLGPNGTEFGAAASGDGSRGDRNPASGDDIGGGNGVMKSALDDGYFALNAHSSLFDIVNRRYEKWGSQIRK